MKKFYTIILILISSLIYNSSEAQSCNYSWTLQSSHTLHPFNTCKAVNEMVCWAAGGGATVRRTTDGGITWLDANPNPGVIAGNIFNMEAIDENTAWVTTETTTSTKVYKTSNAGNNWALVYSNTTGLIKGIRMYDTMNGIAIGSPINGFWNVLLTTDGGNTWNSAPNPPAADFIHQAVHNSFQIDGSNIYWGTSITSIFMSTNGGTNYSENSTPGAGIYMFALRISPNGNGLVAGTSMSRTTDGGVTFQPHNVPGAGNIDAIESAGNDFWYIRGTKVYHSTDNGVTFTDVHTSAQTLFYMDLVDGVSGCQTGWAVGVAGNIYKMTSGVTGISNTGSTVPNKFSLGQNYPNPFNPSTKFEFELPVNSNVKIAIYDMAGRIVQEYNRGSLKAGKYVYEFNGEDLSSGVYFYRLVSDGYEAVKKMILMK